MFFTCGSGITACVLGMAYSLISGKNAVIYDGSWSEYGKNMKRSKKVTIGIIIFFIIVATVIGGRTAMGIYFKNKFGKRPPPGVIVEIVSEKKFSKTIESYCTALSSKTTSFKIKKSELLEPIKFKAIKKEELLLNCKIKLL